MNKGEIIRQIVPDEDDRTVVAAAMDKLSKMERGGVPAASGFLNERQRVLMELVLEKIGARNCVFDGGYDGASRTVAVFFPDWLDELSAKDYSNLSFLRAVWNDGSRPTHRDFLGSIMGLGIKREAVGDILASESSCDIIVLDKIAEVLTGDFESAGRTRLAVSRIERDELYIPAQRFKEIKDTVASLRLDAVTASAFGLARDKAAQAVRMARVSLNEKECTRPDCTVARGDIITARGYGKAALVKIGKTTKKGRISVEIMRYL